MSPPQHGSKIRPFGDRPDDGAMQFSFTLPLPAGPQAMAAARALATRSGMIEIQACHMEPIGGSYSRFIAFGVSEHAVNIDELVFLSPLREELHDRASVDEFILSNVGRPLRVIGACTGADAHTIGLDAVLNIKGYLGNPGLEAYGAYTVINLGSQVENEALVALARSESADVLLVSQVVTQANAHKQTLSALIDLLEDAELRHQMIVICGGPRITHELAAELGYDAGFGVGTLPIHVAGFVAHAFVERHRERTREDKQS